MKKNVIPSINLHLTKKCNMRCKYCFAVFSEVNIEIDFFETIKLLIELREFGFEKVNFVGGEPLLIPRLIELLDVSKQLGFYVSIATNGSLISDNFLKKTSNFINMIGLSIDSLEENTNLKIGRIYSKNPMNIKIYNELIQIIKSKAIKLKINTVVSSLNKNEFFSDFINKINPDRWKIFQVLKIENENSKDFSKYGISKNDFDNFCEMQKKELNNKNLLIKEENEILQGSYLMINPEGHFFDNELGYYTVSEKILKIGIQRALNQINSNYTKFSNRNGNFYLNSNILNVA